MPMLRSYDMTVSTHSPHTTPRGSDPFVSSLKVSASIKVVLVTKRVALAHAAVAASVEHQSYAA
jgi:hypothetical protein